MIQGSTQPVMIDRSRMKQVLYNYLSNAIKFTQHHGMIMIRFIIDKKKVTLQVSDNGVGIPDEKLNLLFSDFQQLNAFYGLNTQGTGLGLSLTKRLVEAQGGSVAVESTFGEGSTFSATLPFQHDS